MSDPVILFSWLHLSDVHHASSEGADAEDRRAVLSVLQADIDATLKRGGVPRPRAIFLTGDVGATGDEPELGKSRDEYTSATTWLNNLLGVVELRSSDVFIVPGNHDVQRHQDRDPDTRRLVEACRRGHEHLDDVLARETDRKRVVARQANYLKFAESYGPSDIKREREGLWWTAKVAMTDGSWLKISGLNTALLARDSDDRGQLGIGIGQLGRLVKTDDSLFSLVLTHHPVAGAWLRDEQEAAKWFETNVDVHLSGHVHAQSSEDRRSGSGRGLVAVSAGAVHVGPTDASTVRNYAYNFAAICVNERDEVLLRVWHRRWSVSNAKFVVDVDNVGEEAFAEHRLAKARQRTRTRQGVPGRTAAYPDPIDFEKTTLADAARLVQARTGLRVELLLATAADVSLWAKNVSLPPDDWKYMILQVACLLAGNSEADKILVGFADTSRLRNGLGDDEFVSVQVILPTDRVRQVSESKVVPPDFWTFVTVRYTETPVSFLGKVATTAFVDFESEFTR